MHKRWGLWMVAMVMAAILSGCGTGAKLPPAPATAAATGGTYRIAALEVLQILVWHHPDLSGQVTVRPDGRISMPLAEDVQAAGRTPQELARDLEQLFSKYVQGPEVTVASMGNTSGTALEQVRVVGEAVRPQSVPSRQNMTLLDVMTRVGGLTEYADGNGAVLLRNAENGAQYRIRLKDLLKRGDMSANVEVLPGDIIIVPESFF